MLRRETNAAFEKSGAWIFSRYRFVAGRTEARKTLSHSAYKRLLASQVDTPALTLEEGDRKRRWWMFRGEFYSEDEGHDVIAVKALILQRSSQQERRVRRAVALMEQTESLEEASGRPSIPDEVKVFVWNRDGGRCVRCGGRERLEFDHVIPLALGGSNTARNLQVLCEACNRAKGASLA